MFKRVLIRLLLGNQKEYFQLIQFKEDTYIVSIRLYEPADVFIRRMEKALHEQG